VKKDFHIHARFAWTASVSLMALLTTAATPLPTAWKYWRYSRAVQLPLVDATRLVSVVVPQDVYLHSQALLPDVRVIDDRSAEVPFTRFTREGSSTTATRNEKLLESSFLPGQYTQLVLDLGYEALFHNSVDLQTNETDFIDWVSVDASDDAREWRIVQERAPIFKFEKERRKGTQVVHYSDNNARYLRVRIFDGKKQFPVTCTCVTYEVSEPPERATIVAGLIPQVSTSGGTSSWRVDLGTAALSVAEVRFAVDPAEFSRSVDIATSVDDREWEPVANGEIYRFRQGDKSYEQLAVRTNVSPDRRYWRVTISNGNDAPLPGAVPTLYMTPQHVIFEQQRDRSYRLLYGQSEAKQAQYDLARRVNAKQMEAAVAGQLGPEEVNTDWSDPRPWTEKYDIILWLAMGIAIALIGLSALRSLRRSTAGIEES
jgi:hypothetical protein